MSDEQAVRIASLDSELRDRISENRELRREAGRALRIIERGDTDSAMTLLRRLSLSTAEK
jgi:hypothetical protein